MKIAKAICALVALTVLTACGGPEEFTSSGGVLPQTGARVDVSRVTAVDQQGTTTVDVVEVNGTIAEIARVNESTTTAQDYGQTALAAVLPGATAGVVQHIVPNECGNNCGGGANQTVVQVGTNVSTDVRSGCATCGAVQRKP